MGIMERMAESPRFKARIAGVFWLLTAVAGTLALVFKGDAGTAVNLVATTCYAVATLLVYSLLKAVNKRLAALAAVFSLTGCAIGAVGSVTSTNTGLVPTLFFGLHCFLVGVLILKSIFLPQFVGVLMVIAGLGWLTRGLVSVLSLPLPNTLFPFLMGAGILGEMTLTTWLLAKGVDEERWMSQAGAGVSTNRTK